MSPRLSDVAQTHAGGLRAPGYEGEAMSTYTSEELAEVLRLHADWHMSRDGGVRADLRDADLGGADLRGADLRGADLRGADLGGAYLRDAYLRDADLGGADLRGADLGGADLRGADLGGADLGGANVSEVRGRRIYSIGPVGSRSAVLGYDVDGDTAWAGCWSGSLAELLERVESVYPDGNQYREQYRDAIEWIMRRIQRDRM